MNIRAKNHHRIKYSDNLLIIEGEIRDTFSVGMIVMWIKEQALRGEKIIECWNSVNCIYSSERKVSHWLELLSKRGKHSHQSQEYPLGVLWYHSFTLNSYVPGTKVLWKVCSYSSFTKPLDSESTAEKLTCFASTKLKRRLVVIKTNQRRWRNELSNRFSIYYFGSVCGCYSNEK